VEFCPACGARMIQVYRNSLTFKCPKCGYKIKPYKEMNINKVKPLDNTTSKIAVLGSQELKLNTHPTVRKTCPICGNAKAETWTVSFGSEGTSSATFFKCTSCGYTSREKE